MEDRFCRLSEKSVHLLQLLHSPHEQEPETQLKIRQVIAEMRQLSAGIGGCIEEEMAHFSSLLEKYLTDPKESVTLSQVWKHAEHFKHHLWKM